MITPATAMAETAASDTGAAAATAAYDALLRGGLARATYEALLEQQRARGLVYDGRPVCEVLRPRLLDASAYAELQRGAELVMRGLSAVVDATRSDARLREALGLGPLAAALARIDGDAPRPDVVGRLDGLVDEEGRARFIEYNPSPAGIALCDEVAEMFGAMPATQALLESWPAEAPSLRRALRDALDRAGDRAGAAGPPRIGVVGRSTKNAAEVAKLLGYLAEGGAPVAPPAEAAAWSMDGGVLRCGGHPVDLVVFLHPDHAAALLQRDGEDHPILRAVRVGAARVLNGLYRSEVLYSKALFAALSDPALAVRFEPEVAEAIARHVPWTRIVRPEMTTSGGREVDLPNLVVEHQDALVLKPARGFGGEGVLLGWQCDAEAWRAALDAALRGPAVVVVQERVWMRAEPFPVLREGELAFEERFADLNPFVWGGDVATGCSVRVCREPLLNVGRGGSIVPAFVLGGERRG